MAAHYASLDIRNGGWLLASYAHLSQEFCSLMSYLQGFF